MRAWIPAGFVLAALYNIGGMVAFTRGFTNEVLFSVDPALFGRAGCFVVCLWGLAYLSLAPHARRAPYVSLAFAVEKVFFAGWWARWMLDHRGELPALAERDPMSASFFAAYGLGDALFAVFFFLVFVTNRGAPTDD